MKAECPKILVNPTIVSQMMWRALENTIDEYSDDGMHVLELGAYQGFLSVFNAHVVKFFPKPVKYHAVDTFEGFPYPGSDREIYKEGDLNPVDNDGDMIYSSLSLIIELQKYGVEPYRGKVESYIEDLTKHLKFSFVFFDLDLGEPTRFCLPYVKRALKVGSIIGFHDYCENPKYSLPEIAEIVNDILANDDDFKEVYRTKKGRDNRFIFLEKIR